jgi:hypothetical protein
MSRECLFQPIGDHLGDPARHGGAFALRTNTS